RVGAVQDARLEHLHIADEERVADGEVGDVEVDVVRDVGRQDLHFERVEHLVEHAAEIAHAVGHSHEVHGNRHGDLLVRLHLVEIEVEDVHGAKRIPLNLADQRLDRRALVHGDVHDGRGGADRAQQLGQGQRLDRHVLGGPVVAVDHGGDPAAAPESTGGALAGLA